MLGIAMGAQLPTPPAEPLRFDGLLLRLPDPVDAEALVRFGDDPDTAETLWVPIPSPCSRAVADERIREFREGWIRPSQFGPTFVIADAATNDFIGVVFLRQHEDSRIEVAYGVAPHRRRQGVASGGLTRITQWCFEALETRSVELLTDANNLGSQRTAERAGFERRGVERTRVPGTGAEYDDIRYVRERPSLG